jgi:hypothetical protein
MMAKAEQMRRIADNAGKNKKIEEEREFKNFLDEVVYPAIKAAAENGRISKVFSWKDFGLFNHSRVEKALVEEGFKCTEGSNSLCVEW